MNKKIFTILGMFLLLAVPGFAKHPVAINGTCFAGTINETTIYLQEPTPYDDVATNRDIELSVGIVTGNPLLIGPVTMIYNFTHQYFDPVSNVTLDINHSYNFTANGLPSPLPPGQSVSYTSFNYNDDIDGFRNGTLYIDGYYSNNCAIDLDYILDTTPNNDSSDFTKASIIAGLTALFITFVWYFNRNGIGD